MVTYKQFYKNAEIIKYYYYVEGVTSSEPGIIEVNLTKQSINIIKPSPRDSYKLFTSQDARLIVNSINEMRKEAGEPIMTEEESIPKETIHYYKYGSHAVNDITKIINEQNRIPTKGTVAWY